MTRTATISFSFFLVIFVTENVYAQRALSPDKIGKLVPAKIKGYYQNGDAKNSLITLGTLRYSLAERAFRSRTKTIRFLLFDYAEAPIMFNQAVKKWREMKPVYTDSLLYQPLSTPDSSAWESWSRSSETAQIIIGINNRFFLNVSSQKISLEELRQLLQHVPFDKFPK